MRLCGGAIYARAFRSMAARPHVHQGPLYDTSTLQKVFRKPRLIERVALSFSMSLALVPVVGLLLNYTSAHYVDLYSLI